MHEAYISCQWHASQEYRCTNRTTKARLRHYRIMFHIVGTTRFESYVVCDTHQKAMTGFKSKTEALAMLRKPWLWCDECAAIHFNTVWQLSPDVRRGTHTHRCNCFLEDNNE